MNHETHTYITDRTEVVQSDWLYSYDGGGFIMIIPEIAPVNPDMVGKPAHRAAYAWEYFLKPKSL